ncbi:hypothetical protein [Flavobacterium microcysteis]|uniref:Uncharacterized protein n=1 Tax=Flavobacterium microcysteis TaxID=2596891 RepID=A0A501QFD8_9FLAO|nr:hypothetical protein [Flavobacterium microcysteis]TPD71094.1 hypothetical protein FJA49_04125 [Flavobacterium microcysteis]
MDIKIEQTRTPEELEALIKRISEQYTDEVKSISDLEFGKFIDSLTASGNRLKSDLETALNLYYPNVNSSLEVRAARLAQLYQIFTPYLSFSKLVNEIISQREARRENQD